MLDVLLRGGSVIDGSGAPARRADVGLRDGRVAEVGDVTGPARRTLDVDGLVVAPGFIDPHVHYDAQVMWDPGLSPTSLQGITTVVGGNCGFGVAPMTADAAGYLMRMLARVEGMPLETLESGADWTSWQSFGQWMGRLDGRLGLNAGFFVGHSTVRRVAMGPEASSRAATPDEIAAMVALVEEALDAGALGISTSLSEAHHDGEGGPVPSRHATTDELLALAATLRRRPGTLFEIVPALAETFGDDERRALADLALAAGQPVLWNALLVDSGRPEYHESLLAASQTAADLGARVVALTIPDIPRLRLSLGSSLILEAVPHWAELFALAPDARLAAIGRPEVRARLADGIHQIHDGPDGPMKRLVTVEEMVVGEAASARNASLNGRTLGAIAAERGVDPLDVLFDLAVDERLDVGFWAPPLGDDPASWQARGEIWQRPDVLVGGGDAGAHLDAIDSFSYPAYLIAESVRERGLLSLEAAIRLLTSVPADLFSLAGRGRLERGAHADVVVLDAATFRPGPRQIRRDLPGGAARLYSEAIGLHHVFVNGAAIVEDGRATGALAGQLLRAGTGPR